jgi:hypothetical protein
MALGFTQSSGGGDFTAILKYDGRAGKMFREDRTQDSSGAWVKNSTEISRTFKAVVDFENIEVGFIMFPPGAAPDFQVVPLGDPFPQRPGDSYNQGVRFMLKLAKECAGDADAIRELAGTSNVFRMGVDELHNAYEAGKAKNPGKLPIVVLKDTIPVTSGQGQKKSTNYQPVFEIVGWASRPDDLVFVPKARTRQATQTASPSVAPSTGSTVAPPPAAKPAMAAADSDFG